MSMQQIQKAPFSLPPEEIQPLIEPPLQPGSDLTFSEKPSEESHILVKIGCCRILPYWADDEDDDGGNDGIAGKRSQLTCKQHGYAAGSLGWITLLSGVFFLQPVISMGAATGSMAISKIWFSNLNEASFFKSRAKQVAFAVSALALAAPFIIEVTIPELDESSESDIYNKVLMSLPWSYPCLGIVKSLLAKELDLKSKIKSFSKLSDHKSELISASVQSIPAFGIVVLNLNTTLTAGAGILAKTNIRKIMDVAGQKIYETKSTALRRTMAAIFMTSILASTSIGFAGNFEGWFNSEWGTLVDLVLVLSGTDIIFRTVKASIKGHINLEKMEAEEIAERNRILGIHPNCSEKMIAASKTLGELLIYTSCIAGFSYLIGLSSQTAQSPAITASLVSDIVACIESGYKKIPFNSSE